MMPSASNHSEMIMHPNTMSPNAVYDPKVHAHQESLLIALKYIQRDLDLLALQGKFAEIVEYLEPYTQYVKDIHRELLAFSEQELARKEQDKPLYIAKRRDWLKQALAFLEEGFRQNYLAGNRDAAQKKWDRFFELWAEYDELGSLK